MNKLNRYLLLLVSLLCVMFMIGCKDDAFSEHALVEVSFTEEGEETGDGSRGLVPDYYGRGSVRLVRNYEPNDLFWLYTAEHKYNVSTGHQSSVYATGETPRDASGNLIKQPVSPDGGYGFADYKKVLSAGDWEIKLYGYNSSNQAGCTDAQLVYTSTKTVTVTESTSLQKVPFTLTLESAYSKRYLFVTSFDVKITDYGQRHTSSGNFYADFYFIKKDLTDLVIDSANLRCSCTTADTFTSAVGNTLHFEDSAGRYEVGDTVVDNNGYVHFFSKIYHSGAGCYADVSDVLVVLTKPGFTTYIDGKVLCFGNINKVGGTLFYIYGPASGCFYYFMDSGLIGAAASAYDAAGDDCSSMYYLSHDYNGTGHVDKYYVWNENLVVDGVKWMHSTNTTNGLDVLNFNPVTFANWASYTLFGHSYSLYGNTTCSDSTNLGYGRPNTEYFLNIPARQLTSSNQYKADWWTGYRCIGPYIKNLRATKAQGCTDWYVPSGYELKLLCDNSTFRTALAKHTRDGYVSSNLSDHYIVSSSVSPSGSGSSVAGCPVQRTTVAYGTISLYSQTGVAPIRSF